MTLKFKAFKPAKLDADVFKSAFMDAARDMAGEVEGDFQKELDAAEFRHAVPFEEIVSSSGNTIKIEVKTNDLGFKYYDQGNGGPSRIIRPTQSNVLHWVDKTGEDVFRKFVHGYKGRFVVAKIEGLWQKKSLVLFQDAMHSAVQRSGQAI